MFLRSADGTQYVNSETINRLQVAFDGTWYLVEASGLNTGGNVDLVGPAVFSTAAAARAARDQLVSVLLGTSEGDSFFTQYQLDILVPAQSVGRLYTFDAGSGVWQVRCAGTLASNTVLETSLADQAAATAAMDAIASAAGSIDVKELVS
jgi:hypothetical protein